MQQKRSKIQKEKLYKVYKDKKYGENLFTNHEIVL